ncbi:C40 family peptidase [Paenibacillus macquariensis]|uniref:NlpC/P60 family protein n=1 Tax=Paenibacillus macquariensis TaxID=948756 RepID=A0ABY1KD56_9BACL|nr:C40 family peptidase [Paenibacillus macquariensis]MEC0093390.1 C40 family peptidase [Paenibacillus macquariensis]OAB29285.1 hydrolase [Paenibacillus macquariensis subsp. macquariensis]SIR63571.1 NlpC/P60 family protein [Paenibacillus macquariensis]
MKKKLTATALSMALALTIGTGSVFADSKMNSVIDRTIGVTYKTGGTTTNGFDCSGFTRYVFLKLGVNLPRQSGSQYNMGTAVSKSQLRPGDLVFFNTLGKGVSHVGISVGNGKFAHASTSRGVIVSSLSESYYAKRYVGAKRVMSTSKYQAAAYN